jgi:hypothetical protein
MKKPRDIRIRGKAWCRVDRRKEPRDIRAAPYTIVGPSRIAYFALPAAAVSRASTVWRAMNSGGGLRMNAFDATLVKRLY